MLFRILILIFLLSVSSAQKFIAVVEFSGKGISTNDVSTLTDRFGLEMFRTGKFVVAEREMVNQILDEQGFQQTGCTTDECLVEMGKLIGVNYIIGGSVSKFGTIYSVSLRMVDIEKGIIVKSAIYDHDGRFEELLITGMKKAAYQFIDSSEPEKIVFEDSESEGLVVEKTPIEVNWRIFLTNGIVAEASQLKYLKGDMLYVIEDGDEKPAPMWVISKIQHRDGKIWDMTNWSSAKKLATMPEIIQYEH